MPTIRRTRNPGNSTEYTAHESLSYGTISNKCEGLLFSVRSIVKPSLITLIFIVYFLMGPKFSHADDLVSRFQAISRMLQGHSTVQKPPPVDYARRSVNPYLHIIHKAGTTWKIDPLLIKSVIRHESNFDPNAVSHKGACGLMQLMPGTAKDMGVQEIFDPFQNIHGGTRYLQMMHQRYDGDLYKTLLAYNAGPTRVDSGRIPQESHVYAARVIDTYQMLRRNRNEN